MDSRLLAVDLVTHSRVLSATDVIVGPFKATSKDMLQSAIAFAFAMPVWAVMLFTVEIVTDNEIDPLQPRTLWGWRVTFTLDATQALLSPIIAAFLSPGSGVAGLPSAVNVAISGVVIPALGTNAELASVLGYPSMTVFFDCLFSAASSTMLLLVATVSTTPVTSAAAAMLAPVSAAYSNSLVAGLTSGVGIAGFVIVVITVICVLRCCRHHHKVHDANSQLPHEQPSVQHFDYNAGIDNDIGNSAPLKHLVPECPQDHLAALCVADPPPCQQSSDTAVSVHEMDVIDDELNLLQRSSTATGTVGVLATITPANEPLFSALFAPAPPLPKSEGGEESEMVCTVGVEDNLAPTVSNNIENNIEASQPGCISQVFTDNVATDSGKDSMPTEDTIAFDASATAAAAMAVAATTRSLMALAPSVVSIVPTRPAVEWPPEGRLDRHRLAHTSIATLDNSPLPPVSRLSTVQQQRLRHATFASSGGGGPRRVVDLSVFTLDGGDVTSTAVPQPSTLGY